MNSPGKIFSSMIRVSIVGLGNIASLYDQKAALVPRSHIGALLCHPNFRISALVDTSEVQLEKTKNLWPQLTDCEYLLDLETLDPERSDIIVICTPPEVHLEQIEMAVSKKPKLLVVEKPMSTNLTEARKIKEIIERDNIPLIVNFLRRFDRHYLALRDCLRETPNKIIMLYNNGFFNYASHHVDFLIDWYGPIKTVQAFGDQDKENPSFLCRMSCGFDVFIIGVEDVGYDQFELEMFFRDKKITFGNGGCEKVCQRAQKDLYYSGYAQLGKAEPFYEPGPLSGMVGLYRQVAEWFDDNSKQPPGCGIDEAIHGMKVLEAVGKSQIENARLVEISHE